MPDINAWLGVNPPLELWTSNEDRSYDTARAVNAKKVLITILRDGIELTPQYVRIEVYRHPSKFRGLGMNEEIAEETVMIIGFKDNPIMPDTDIRRGDRFRIDNMSYDVTQVLQETGPRLIAIAKVSE